MEIFSTRLRSLQKNMNTSEFARFLGVKQQTLDNYLKSKRVPTIEFVLTVCNKCCKSADWILGLTESEENPNSVFSGNKIDERSAHGMVCPECAKKDAVIANQRSIIIEALHSKGGCQPETRHGGKAKRKGA